MKSLFACLFLAICFADVANAQTESKDSVITDPLPIQLPGTTVTADRWPDKQVEVPRQVVVLPETRIAELNPQTAATLLQSTGQVNVQYSQQGGGSPVLRGFEANRVLLVLDGVRMNNAIFREGHLQNVLRIDPASLDRAEVLFGPGAVPYGADALGGVLLFATHKPSFALNVDSGVETKGNGFVRFSSANLEKTLHVGFNIAGKRLASFTSFTFSDFDDLRQGNNSQANGKSAWNRNYYVRTDTSQKQFDQLVKNDKPNVQVGTGYRQTNFMQKFLFRTKPNAKTEHSLDFYFTTTSDVPRYDRMTDPKSTTNDSLKRAAWYYGPEQWLFAHYMVNTRLSETSRIRFSLAAQHIEESRNTRGFLDSTLNKQQEKLNVLNVNVDYLHNFNPKNEFHAGVESQLNMLKSTAVGTNIITGAEKPISARYPGGDSYNTFAAYANHSMQLPHRFRLTFGVRYSLVSLHITGNTLPDFPFVVPETNHSFSALNGQVGLVKFLKSKYRVSVSGSSGFRAPNLDDEVRLFNPQPNQLILPNPTLKPEYAYTGELTAEKFDGKWRAAITGWYTLLVNAIEPKRTTYMGADSVVFQGTKYYVVSNMNEKDWGKIMGITASINYVPNKNWNAYATATYMKGTVGDKAEGNVENLAHIPPAFGRIGLQYTKKRFGAEFWTQWNAKKALKDYNLEEEDNLNYATPDGMPAWYTLNLRAQYKVQSNVTFQAALENILDTRYRTFASGTSAPGRNLVLVLRLSL